MANQRLVTTKIYGDPFGSTSCVQLVHRFFAVRLIEILSFEFPIRPVIGANR